jgi:hypothetical protein
MNDPQLPSAAPLMPSPQDVMMQMWMGLCSAHAVAVLTASALQRARHGHVPWARTSRP